MSITSVKLARQHVDHSRSGESEILRSGRVCLSGVLLSQYTRCMTIHLRIDRELSVPVTDQLRGQLEYGIAFGDIPAGSQLPSVRELSERLGVAPVTVSQVYSELQGKGLLETRIGRGTFVRLDAPRPEHPDHQSLVLGDLERRLAKTAFDIGLSTSDLTQILAVRLSRIQQFRALRMTFVGNFEQATRSYVHELLRYLPPGDRLETAVLSELRSSDEERERARDGDAVLTLAYRAAEVESLLGSEIPILTVPFLPARETRTRLARLSGLQRIGIVSTYTDYLLPFRQSVEIYAPHIDVFRASVLGDDDVGDLLHSCDVVIYATGADGILRDLPPTARAFEYRFAPDPRAVVQETVARLERLRNRESPHLLEPDMDIAS